MKKNPLILFGAILILSVGTFWVYESKDTILVKKQKVEEVNLLFLPRYRYVDHPSILSMSKDFDPTPVINKLEKSLSDDKVRYKVRFDGNYPLKEKDFSHLKNTIVFGNSTFLYRMSKKGAPLDPLLTISANAVHDCKESGALITLSETPFNSLQEAAGKTLMVEGMEGAPQFLLGKAVRDINGFGQGIFSEISYSIKKENLLKALEEKQVDMLFLTMYEVPGEGVFTLYGKVVNDNAIDGHENLKIVHRVKENIPCGFVMATYDVLPDVRTAFGKAINNFTLTPQNQEFMDKSIGIKTFHPVGIDTWQRAYEFMVDNDVESASGKLIITKTKKSSEQ